MELWGELLESLLHKNKLLGATNWRLSMWFCVCTCTIGNPPKRGWGAGTWEFSVESEKKLKERERGKKDATDGKQVVDGKLVNGESAFLGCYKLNKSLKSSTALRNNWQIYLFMFKLIGSYFSYLKNLYFPKLIISHFYT